MKLFVSRLPVALLLILFSCTNINAQQLEWAPIGAKWHYGEGSGIFPYDEAYMTIEVIGDTLFQNKEYKVLFLDSYLELTKNSICFKTLLE